MLSRHDLVAGGVGPTKWKAPADYTKALLDAISAEKCKDTTFYKYACDQNNVITDERANLTNGILSNVNFRKKALVRRAALNLMEGWGMESKPCKYQWENNKVVASNVAIKPARPANEDELEDEEKWNLYVRSLKFTKPVSSSPSLAPGFGNTYPRVLLLGQCQGWADIVRHGCDLQHEGRWHHQQAGDASQPSANQPGIAQREGSGGL